MKKTLLNITNNNGVTLVIKEKVPTRWFESTKKRFKVTVKDKVLGETKLSIDSDKILELIDKNKSDNEMLESILDLVYLEKVEKEKNKNPFALLLKKKIKQKGKKEDFIPSEECWMKNNNIKTLARIIKTIKEMQKETRHFEDIVGSLFIDYQGFLKIGQKYEDELIKIGASLFSENDEELSLNVEWIEWYLYEMPVPSEKKYNVKIDCKEFNIKTPEDLGEFLKFVNKK